jgi:cytochrome b subunit of formate dehydrogenase
LKNLIVILFFLNLTAGAFALVQEVPFTLDDRDRIMRTEEQLKSLRNEMNTKFDAVDTRFESLESKFELNFWLFGILFALILFIMGYIIWDRRTALYPVQEKTQNLDNRMVKLESIAREQAKKDPDFAEILRLAGLL